MTVKEAASVLKSAQTIFITWDGRSFEFDKGNLLMMEAYGNFVVDNIMFCGREDEEKYEIGIAMRPVKAGDVA